MSGSAEARLQELGIELPAAPAAIGAYVPALQVGNLVMTSGQLPMRDGALVFTGKVGSDLTLKQGADAARLAAINALTQIRGIVGSLDRVKRIFRVEGFVNSADGFTGQPGVLNGASNFLSEVFGPAGTHTRFAVGVNELPLDAAVEVAVWAEVE